MEEKDRVIAAVLVSLNNRVRVIGGAIVAESDLVHEEDAVRRGDPLCVLERDGPVNDPVELAVCRQVADRVSASLSEFDGVSETVGMRLKESVRVVVWSNEEVRVMVAVLETVSVGVFVPVGVVDGVLVAVGEFVPV
eukprot:TRINITY_DN27850_c0_g1_i1.p2 TRINITY_DN27850_c0_g1~~TRINITY_DN27850_c0_g1_i1.p2  ORF type:complete len:137 (-),score=27.17 TRINITY_DN27850_c0_g1_i1:202-612(-)